MRQHIRLLMKGPPRRAEMGMRSPPGRAQSRLSRQPLPPTNPPSGVPAIHRGQQPASEVLLSGFAAHGATNLFHRGRHPSLEGILQGVTAHGELQELPTRLRTLPLPLRTPPPHTLREPPPHTLCEPPSTPHCELPPKHPCRSTLPGSPPRYSAEKLIPMGMATACPRRGIYMIPLSSSKTRPHKRAICFRELL